MDYLDTAVEAIKPILKDYGFKKQHLNWFIEDDNIIKIFNIQKSLYGKQVYLNIGIFIKRLEPKKEYLSYKCHIKQRLDLLIGREYLDFENNIDDEQRIVKFKQLLNSNPYTFFTMKGTSEDIDKFSILNNG